MPDKVKLSNSSISDFRFCPMRYYYKYILGVVSTGHSPALTFGLGIHAALAAFFWAKDPAAGYDALELIPESWPDSDRRDRAYAEHIYREYIGNHASKLGDLQAIEVYAEVEFDNFILKLVVDGVTNDQYKRLSLVEHKTTSIMSERYMTEFLVDWQVTGYIAAAQRLGFPISNALINIIFLGRKSKTQRFPNTEFMLVPVSRSKTDLLRWEHAIDYTVRSIGDCMVNGFPRLDNCYTGVPGAPYTCSYVNLCLVNCSTKEEALKHGFEERKEREG